MVTIVSTQPHPGSHIHANANGVPTVSDCDRNAYRLSDSHGHHYTYCDGDSIAYLDPRSSDRNSNCDCHIVTITTPASVPGAST